jgi:hypothetical protein
MDGSDKLLKGLPVALRGGCANFVELRGEICESVIRFTSTQ